MNYNLHLLAIIHLLIATTTCSAMEKKITFSPDGKKITIKLTDKCIVSPVPLEVVYQPNTQKKYLLIDELLKKHNLPPHKIMPNLLEAFKR